MGFVSTLGSIASTGTNVAKSVFKAGSGILSGAKNLVTSKFGLLGIGAVTAGILVSKNAKAEGVENSGEEKSSGFGGLWNAVKSTTENVIGGIAGFGKKIVNAFTGKSEEKAEEKSDEQQSEGESNNLENGVEGKDPQDQPSENTPQETPGANGEEETIEDGKENEGDEPEIG